MLSMVTEGAPGTDTFPVLGRPRKARKAEQGKI